MDRPDENQQQPAEESRNSVSQSSAEASEETAAEEQEKNQITISFSEYQELKTLAEERDEYLKRLKRSVADHMNLKKRVKKLRESAQKDALRKVAGKILPLADSLARARNVAEETAGAEQITEGLRMTEEEFYAILQQLDIEPIESLGQRFDPTYHEAVFQRPAPDAEPNTVIEEIKKGFLFKGELLRAAQVVVAQPSGG